MMSPDNFIFVTTVDTPAPFRSTVKIINQDSILTRSSILLCKECGSLILSDVMEIHVDWHQRLECSMRGM